MASNLILWTLHALTAFFFLGLSGCVLVVLISWISIFSSGFSPDKPSDT